MERFAIHQAQNSETVVKFLESDKFVDEVVKMYENGNVYGFFFNENGVVCMQDIWQEIHSDILK